MHTMKLESTSDGDVSTDGDDYPVYEYIYNNKPVWFHFYDEGLFYDGFYVINDLEVWKQFFIFMKI